jgi:2'-5' RNA ligase
MPCVDGGAIETVTLYNSDLSGDRPQYEALERFML